MDDLSQPSPAPGPGNIPQAPPDRSPYVAVKSPQIRPLVTYAILGLTVGVFLLQMLSQLTLGEDLPFILGAKYNPYILQGQIWRLFTPMLLHGSLVHIGFNMYALYIFGRNLERFYGHIRFLALYLLAAFAGNVASFLLTQNVSVGASTAIYGLLGAEAMFLYTNRELFGERMRASLYNVVFIAVVNLLISLSPGIDLWGHVGGLVGGGLFAFLAGPLLQVQGGFPAFSLEDRRTTAQVWTAGFLVGGIFCLLTVVGFFRG